MTKIYTFYFSPCLRNVEKYSLSLQYNVIFKHLLPLVNTLKTISPRMKQCVVKVKRHSKLSEEMLQKYRGMIDGVIQNMKEKWQTIDIPFHIDLTFDVYVYKTLFKSLENVKEVFKNSDYVITEIPKRRSGSIFCASKSKISTEKFSANVRIPIHLSLY